MPQQRTPRQKQGDGLVPLLVRVTPQMRAQIEAQAAASGGVPLSAVVRLALRAYFRGRDSC
jgi:hypothetical protein